MTPPAPPQNLCSNDRTAGEWLRSLDLVLRRREGDAGAEGLYIHVADRYPAVRDCTTNTDVGAPAPTTNVRGGPANHECAAIRRSCLRVIEDHDLDLAEFAVAHQHSMSRSKATNRLCYELNEGICRSGRALPADLEFSEFLAGPPPAAVGDEGEMLDASADDENRLRLSPFVVLNKEAYEMERMMMDMQVRGAAAARGGGTRSWRGRLTDAARPLIGAELHAGGPEDEL